MDRRAFVSPVQLRSRLAGGTCILISVKEGFLFGPFAAIGAKTTLLKFIMKPAQGFALDFSEYDVPKSAKILQVIYSPNNGGLFPLETHSNNPARHFIPSKIDLWPRPIGTNEPTDTLVNVAVTWVPHTDDDLAWQNLVDAFEAFAANKYKSAVIPANVAVESTLVSLLSDFLMAKKISSEHVKRFLSDGATYSHQLNVVLPALLSFTSAPILPDAIRGKLNRLRALRNDLAHEGELEEEVSSDEMAECLCAAVFGFYYLKIVKQHLV